MKGPKGKGTSRVTKEALKPVDDRKVGKRKAAIKADKGIKPPPTKKNLKAKKDPNKPKRPPSAFFVFLEEFRKEFKRDNPNVKAVSVVGKAGGEKWKSLSHAEKAPFEAKAAKRKADYNKLIKAYDNKKAAEDEESERSKSEVNDEDEASEEEHQEDDDDDDDDAEEDDDDSEEDD